jgi:tetratricopeptide (TPR) repeat protein
LQEIRRAQEIDPLSLIINTDLGEILFHDRRYDEAILQENRTLEMDPNFVLASGILAQSYIGKHEEAQALAALRKGMKVPGAELFWGGVLGITYARMGQEHLARAMLRQLQEKAEGQHIEELYLSMAEIYSALGDKDNTFLWLNKDYLTRDGGLTLIQLTPCFDWLHSERFAE